MTNHVIPEAAVEAAAERTWLDSERARRSGDAWAALSELQQTLRRARARRILEAAAPHMLAKAWDLGEAAGQDNADSNRGHDIAHKYNPYRTAQ